MLKIRPVLAHRRLYFYNVTILALVETNFYSGAWACLPIFADAKKKGNVSS